MAARRHFNLEDILILQIDKKLWGEMLLLSFYKIYMTNLVRKLRSNLEKKEQNFVNMKSEVTDEIKKFQTNSTYQ